MTGREVWCGAYPYGEAHQINTDMYTAAKNSGLEICFTQIYGTNDNNKNKFAYNRIGIAPQDDFIIKLSGIQDWKILKPLLK